MKGNECERNERFVESLAKKGWRKWEWERVKKGASRKKRRWTKNLNWNISEIRIVPGPKEARFPHLWHAGPTATSGPNHHHHQHRACHDYFRWTATASGIGDRLSRSPRPITITISAIMNKKEKKNNNNITFNKHHHRPPLLLDERTMADWPEERWACIHDLLIDGCFCRLVISRK